MEQTIKSLNTRRKLSREKLGGLETEVLETMKRRDEEKNRLQVINRDIKNYEDNLKNKKEVEITEHALLRYIENIKGMDLKAIREEILDEKVKEQISTLGNGKFHKDDYEIRVKNRKVVTIVKR